MIILLLYLDLDVFRTCNCKREFSECDGSKYVMCFVFSDDLFSYTVCLLICFSVSSCALGFVLGLLFTQRSGNYFVTMFDDYSATLPLVIVVVFETYSVAWVYGTDR